MRSDVGSGRDCALRGGRTYFCAIVVGGLYGKQCRRLELVVVSDTRRQPYGEARGGAGFRCAGSSDVGFWADYRARLETDGRCIDQVLRY